MFLIQLIFEKLGYVRTACNGKEGLIEVKQTRPDLIILDLMMPEMSGIEFMKCLKDDGLSDIPILLLTANTNNGQEDVKSADCICYKPIDVTNRVIRKVGVFVVLTSMVDNFMLGKFYWLQVRAKTLIVFGR